MHAELNGIICSGPRQGSQFTYALLDERAPTAPTLPREEALAELTRRYFRGHGPATIHDFVWWSGLTMADAKAGLALVTAEVRPLALDGQTYYQSATLAPAAESAPTAHVLPTYDEFLVGYAGFDRARRGGDATQSLVFDAAIVIDGAVVGSWRRTRTASSVHIDLAPFRPLTSADTDAVLAAAHRYGTFVGRPVQVAWVDSRTERGRPSAH